ILLRELGGRVLVAEPGRGRRHVQELALVDARQELAAEPLDDGQARERGQRSRNQRQGRPPEREVHERPVRADQRGRGGGGGPGRRRRRRASRRSRSAGATVSVTSAPASTTRVLVSASGRSSRPVSPPNANTGTNAIAAMSSEVRIAGANEPAAATTRRR